MFVGCSEISTSVIVKHKQHIGIIRAFCLPGWGGGGQEGLSFSVPVGTEKLLGLGLLGGISTQADTMNYSKHTIKISLAEFFTEFYYCILL